MKILVFGAGVIGSIYAVKLYAAGFDVTLLARTKRYESLQQNGVNVRNVLTGKQLIKNVPLTQQLDADDIYDLIIVTVRLDQLESVIPILKKNVHSPTILFMLNNPSNMERFIKEFPYKKIILGFPGAGGTCQNQTIDYIEIKEQKTTIGDIDGNISKLTKEIKTMLEQAGFKVSVSANMQSWLKTHAVFMACVSAAIIKENGNPVQLGKNKSSIQIMVKSVNEGFRALRQLGIHILPANLKTIFMIMPQWFSVWYWQKAMQGKTGTLAMAPHANTAKDEMQLLAQRVLDIVHSSSIATPTLDNLLSKFINPKQN